MKILYALIAAALVAAPATAQTRRPSPYETLDQQRQRVNAENYESYQRNSYEAPRGGYRNSPVDADQPGMARPDYSKGYQRRDDSFPNDEYNNRSWR